MRPIDYSRIHFFLFFGIFGWLAYSMFQPYIHAAVFGLVFYSLFKPLMARLEGRKFLKKNISTGFAAMLVCLVILLVVLIPIVWIVYQVSIEATLFFSSMRKFFETAEMKAWFANPNISLIPDSITGYIPEFIVNFFHRHFSGLEIDFEALRNYALESINVVGGTLYDTLNDWFTDTIGLAFQFAISLIFTFAFLCYGTEILYFFRKIIPLSGKHVLEIFDKINQMNVMNIMVNGIGGVIQGLGAGAVFWMTGSNSVVFLSIMMILLAFIPLIGISIIYIPYSIVLLIESRYIEAIFVFVVCSALSLYVENFYKPKILGKFVQINSLLMLMSILGGLSYFGIVGIIYGPLVVVVFMSLVDIFNNNIQKI